MSRPGPHVVVAVISKVLSLKSGRVLIAALAASTINALPAGSEQLARMPVSGPLGRHSDGSSFVRGNRASALEPRRHRATLLSHGRRGSTWCASTSGLTRRSSH